MNRLPPPSPCPRPEEALAQASVWFSSSTPLTAKELEALADLGIEGIIAPASPGSPGSAGGALRLATGAQLIGDALPIGPDFLLALKKWGPYPSLYHLVEIDAADWNLLPPPHLPFANVPWLSLQALEKKGYVPAAADPFTKSSAWNATAPIQGIDGKTRRWIYWKTGDNAPRLNWTTGTLAAHRLIAADALRSIYEKNASLLLFSSPEGGAVAELIRKARRFSALIPQQGVRQLIQMPTDLAIDPALPWAFQHGLIAQQATALKILYRFYLNADIQPRSLIHEIPPFPSDCKGRALLAPTAAATFDERASEEAIRKRLLSIDAFRAFEPDQPLSSWMGLCLSPLSTEEITLHAPKILRLHQLFALFAAFQPGALLASPGALLGDTDELSQGASSLFGSLARQKKQSRSFASYFQRLTATRQKWAIPAGALLEVPDLAPSLFTLLFKTGDNKRLALLAINLSPQPIHTHYARPEFSGASAIDALTELTHPKPLQSDSCPLHLEGHSGKLILFQPKYYP
jgi:hypothetical protein